MVAKINTKQRFAQGFTIVELLIVVVVIAILAAITIVSFNGISQRTRNTARVVSAQAIMKGIAAYEAMHGRGSLYTFLPQTEAPEAYCIGTDYIDVSPTPDHSCRYVVRDGSGYSTPVNQELYDAIQSVAQFSMDYAPVTQRNIGTYQSITASSPFIQFSPDAASTRTYILDGREPREELLLLSYRLEGENKDCGLPVVRLVSETPLHTTYKTEGPNSTVLGGATECWVWLEWQ